MDIYRGDIVVAKLDPVQGSEQGGIRPVLIIQNNIGNKHSRTIIVAPFTTRVFDRPHPTRVTVSKEETKLKHDSTILLHQIRTIDKRRIGKCISNVSSVVQRKVDAAIKASLSLD